MTLPVPQGTIRNMIRKKVPLAYPKFPAIVDSVGPKAQFTNGRLQKDDQIIGMNGSPIGSYRELTVKKENLANKEVQLSVLRGADTVQVGVKLDENAFINFVPRASNKLLEYAVREFTFFESLPAGVAKGWEMLIMNIQNFKLLFTSKEVKASESLGSFLSIGDMFDAGWDWQLFWRMTALLSIVLAFMNMLPIPALDGGHVLFTLYEIITGRKPGDKFMEYAQMVGMVLLLGLMAYALGLDIWRVFRN
jgi:regulator of sigma E protease